MKDISSTEDITILVDQFYDLVLKDDLLSPYFKNLDFDHHLPKMIQFWEFVLLDKPGYTTDVTAVHLKMRLSDELFDRWIELFNNTIDQNFIGEKANLAKQRALIVSVSIKSKL